MYEKVYSPENEYSAEYPFSEWDSVSSTTKYFKKLAYEITDEEYEEVKKYLKTSFLGFTEIIKLLEDIKNKKRHTFETGVYVTEFKDGEHYKLIYTKQ